MDTLFWITAKTSLTLTPEMCVIHFGRCYDVSRIALAPTRYSSQASRRLDLDHLSRPTAQPRLVLSLVAALYPRRPACLARSLACAQDPPQRALRPNASGDPLHSRPPDAPPGTARSLSPGRCAYYSLRTGVFGLYRSAQSAHDRTSAARSPANQAALPTSGARGFPRLSGCASDPQQPRTSTGLDWATLPQRLAPPVVFSGLSRQLRPSRLCRISAQTQTGKRAGLCGTGLAEDGAARDRASRQRRAVRTYLSSRFAQPLHSLGLAGRRGVDLHPRARTLAQWLDRALQWLVAGTLAGRAAAFGRAGTWRTGGDDEKLFPGANPSTTGFPNGSRGASHPEGAELARQLRSPPASVAGQYRTGQLYTAR